MKPICRKQFDAQCLVDDNPAQLNDWNKKIVFDLCAPRDAIHTGTITFTRWEQVQLPSGVGRQMTDGSFEIREDYFAYDSSPQGTVEWYLNFAHAYLFCAYGGSLFAQDEMQVTEHPALASLRHALIKAEIKPLTVENGTATPVLIAGVERRCSVATDVNAAEGRPYGLYGNNFSGADEAAILQATRLLEPPTTSNIIAMEAPACGEGRYTREQLTFILSTAFTGFKAAVGESKRETSSAMQTVIHTGYWGCGAYGGNRQLMPLLQMIAACYAGVDSLVFHTGGDKDGYTQGKNLLDELLPLHRHVSSDELLSRIEEHGFEWGVSDGN
jgi:hypothetical protein